MNDYGYPSYTLPTLGQFDNWGKQVLYCNVKGGFLRNEAGVATALSYDPMTMAQRQEQMAAGFMFWDSDNINFATTTTSAAQEATSGVEVGTVNACAFAGKNYKGGATVEPGVSSWNDVFSNKVRLKLKKLRNFVHIVVIYI